MTNPNPNPTHDRWHRRHPWAAAVLLSLATGIGAAAAYASTLPTQPAGTVDAVHDGRYHPCGMVTEDGVTEHLEAYRQRCGTP